MNIFYSSSQDILDFRIREFVKNNKCSLIDCLNLTVEEANNLILQDGLFSDPNEKKVIMNFDFIKKNAKNYQNDNLFFFVKSSKKPTDSQNWQELKKITKKEVFKIIKDTFKKENIQYDENIEEIIYNFSLENPLKLFKDLEILISSEKKITKEVVFSLLSNENNEPKIFSMAKLIISKNINESLKLLDELILNKFDVIAIINLISDEIFKFYIIKKMIMENLNDFSISKITNIPVYFLNDYKNTIFSVDINVINNLLQELYFLDYNIKSGNSEPLLSFKKILIANGKK